MSAAARESRRRFLVALGVLGAGSAAGVAGWRLADTDGLRERLGRILGAGLDPGALGATYLAAHPEHADVDALVDVLAADLGWSARLSGEGKLRHRIVARAQDDFREGRTLPVERWVVSVTEARLSALVELLRRAE